VGEDVRQVELLTEEIQRLKWRISTLETAEFECARAVTALAASETRYRRLLDEAGFPITISRALDSTILFANPLACRLFGLEGPVPSGRRMLEFYPEPLKRAALVERMRTQGPIRDWETVMLDGKGHLLVMLISASLITYEDQEAVLATSNDITDRRYAEALFRTVVETSPDGFVLADMEGRLTYASPRTLEIFGYSDPGEVLGRKLLEFAVPEEHARVEDHLRGLVIGKYSGPTEFLALRKDGCSFPQETNGEVLRNPDGSPRAFLFTVRCLIARKRVERTLRWAEKLESLGLMAAGIAHELNNAFQVTQGHLEMAQHLSGEGHPVAESLAKIQGGVDRATALAKEMLDYSGQTLRSDAPLDLGDVVKEYLAFWQEFLTSGASLVFVPGRDLPPVHADEGQMIKVISALVLNAIEAMEGLGGTVVISTNLQELTEADLPVGFWPGPGRPGRFLRVQIQDSGAGIPAESLERVCDPFFTTKGKGRGLGLSAALGILRAHSGCLQILCPPSEGTTIRAYLPLVEQTLRVPAAKKDSRALPTGILVVDDEDSIRELVVHMLQDWGCSPVWSARDGLEALELFQSHQSAIGLLLTDATMPRMSGPEAFEAMRHLNPSLYGVLMSGYSEAFGQGTATAFGFADFLQKPFRFRDLKSKLDGFRSAQGKLPDHS